MSGGKMARWSWPMVLLPVGDDDCAVLNQDWTVSVRGWAFTVPRHTRTDGASIPRWLWAICGHPLQSPRVYAAIVHDWLYGGGGPGGMTRAEADAVYRELLVRFGWGRTRAWIEWLAIRACGRGRWSERKEK